MFPAGYEIGFDQLNDPLFIEKNITLSVARLDKIHPIISGNKLFKLHYFLEEANITNADSLLTFGGAYSNHLVATAYAAKDAGIKSIGIVRGEMPAALSNTLRSCIKYGMKLHFISRKDYSNKDEHAFITLLKNTNGCCIVIPEGGYHPKGAAGSSLIMDMISTQHATHVCVPVGTATTLAGLLMNRPNDEKIIGVPVLKNMPDIKERLTFLGAENFQQHLILFDEYHFGGYAKKTSGLLSFMNSFYSKHYIPTDFVYTAKMMFGIIDKIKSGFFSEGSRIICIHTGGLQGNDSLEAGTLVF